MRPILHIPHAGREVPERYHKSFIGGLDTINAETGILGDLWTDKLFVSKHVKSLPVIFPYSRVFVDVERFRDDKEETMAKRGMGALYRNGHDLRTIRNAPALEEHYEILKHYYDPHHEKLTQIVERELEQHSCALIIDCHSFPKERLAYEDPNPRDRPEICIGTDAFHTPNVVSETMLNSFLAKGYTVALNQPFAGALVPLPHYQRSRTLASVMVEVRRDLFLSTENGQPNEHFSRIQADVADAILSTTRAFAQCPSLPKNPTVQ